MRKNAAALGREAEVAPRTLIIPSAWVMKNAVKDKPRTIPSERA